MSTKQVRVSSVLYSQGCFVGCIFKVIRLVGCGASHTQGLRVTAATPCYSVQNQQWFLFILVAVNYEMSHKHRFLLFFGVIRTSSTTCQGKLELT